MEHHHALPFRRKAHAHRHAGWRIEPIKRQSRERPFVHGRKRNDIQRMGDGGKGRKTDEEGARGSQAHARKAESAARTLRAANRVTDKPRYAPSLGSSDRNHFERLPAKSNPSTRQRIRCDAA